MTPLEQNALLREALEQTRKLLGAFVDRDNDAIARAIFEMGDKALSLPIPSDHQPGAGLDGYKRLEAQMRLIFITLGLNPGHDPVTCIRVLHDDGREAFEKLRGERCDFSYEWKPFVYRPTPPKDTEI